MALARNMRDQTIHYRNASHGPGIICNVSKLRFYLIHRQARTRVRRSTTLESRSPRARSWFKSRARHPPCRSTSRSRRHSPSPRRNRLSSPLNSIRYRIYYFLKSLLCWGKFNNGTKYGLRWNAIEVIINLSIRMEKWYKYPDGKVGQVSEGSKNCYCTDIIAIYITNY